jgi:hypothetical protein
MTMNKDLLPKDLPPDDKRAIEAERALTQMVASEARESVVVVADNVTKYFFEVSPQEEWGGSEDFPNLAPPFRRMFIETRKPEFIYSDECGKTDFSERGIAKDILGWGTLVLSDELDEAVWESEGRWRSFYYLIFRFRNFIGVHSTAYVYYIDKSGRLMEEPGLGVRWGIWDVLAGSPSDVPQKVVNAANWIYPFLLTVSFMNCRNVTMQEERPLSRPERRNLQRKGVPLLEYHVLEIEPMKEVLRTEGGSESAGLAKALHICRGHFKDYTESGLFGKYHGVYWWHDSVRGDSRRGAVGKTYEVNAPNNPSE